MSLTSCSYLSAVLLTLVAGPVSGQTLARVSVGTGGTQANVDRWFKQFEEPKEKINPKSEEVTIGKHKVTFVQAEGTYKSGMPGGPSISQPNSMLLGAILEGDQGSVFIKLTGPAILVKASQDSFKKMVRSAVE